MANSHRKRILLVDDDAGLRKIITANLESIGFAVTAVEGATAAIALIESEIPDAILTDIHMAKGDGFELISAVRDRGLTIPIVAMSGGSSTLLDADHLEYALKLGAAAIVDKPFRISHLVEAIDRAIGGRATMDDTSK